jgi:hypothetical protein
MVLRGNTHPSSRVKTARKCGIEQATGEKEFFGYIAFDPTTPHPSSRVYSLISSKSTYPVFEV